LFNKNNTVCLKNQENKFKDIDYGHDKFILLKKYVNIVRKKLIANGIKNLRYYLFVVSNIQRMELTQKNLNPKRH